MANVLEPVLGSTSKERVLLYLACRGEGYPREIARFFGASLRPVQMQMEGLEAEGVLWSRVVGRTRVYAFNPRYAFIKELKALVEKALPFYPAADRKRLMMNRRRPRKAGKPL